jgi:hypothetical protein
VQCTVQVCRRNWRTCTPHHTVAGRSSISLTQSPFPFPSAIAAANPLLATCRAVPLHPYALASRQIICPSHMLGRAVASFARVQAELHISSHTVQCARLVHLWSSLSIPPSTCDKPRKPSDRITAAAYLEPCISRILLKLLSINLNALVLHNYT